MKLSNEKRPMKWGQSKLIIESEVVLNSKKWHVKEREVEHANFGVTNEPCYWVIGYERQIIRDEVARYDRLIRDKSEIYRSERGGT